MENRLILIKKNNNTFINILQTNKYDIQKSINKFRDYVHQNSKIRIGSIIYPNQVFIRNKSLE